MAPSWYEAGRHSGAFDEMVAFPGVEKFLEIPVKHYSSGMYLRLAFSVAAHLDPEVLFVDEVLAVGDAAFQKKCIGKMGEVAGRGEPCCCQPQHGRRSGALSEGYLAERWTG